MNVVTTAIEGVLILEPKVLGDSRGFFMESLRVSADFPSTLGSRMSTPSMAVVTTFMIALGSRRKRGF